MTHSLSLAAARDAVLARSWLQSRPTLTDKKDWDVLLIQPDGDKAFRFFCTVGNTLPATDLRAKSFDAAFSRAMGRRHIGHAPALLIELTDIMQNMQRGSALETGVYRKTFQETERCLDTEPRAALPALFCIAQKAQDDKTLCNAADAYGAAITACLNHDPLYALRQLDMDLHAAGAQTQAALCVATHSINLSALQWEADPAAAMTTWGNIVRAVGLVQAPGVRAARLITDHARREQEETRAPTQGALKATLQKAPSISPLFIEAQTLLQQSQRMAPLRGLTRFFQKPPKGRLTAH